MFYKETNYIFALQLNATYLLKDIVRDRAGVARWAHNPKVVGSNPSPATNKNPLAKLKGFLFKKVLFFILKNGFKKILKTKYAGIIALFKLQYYIQFYKN